VLDLLEDGMNAQLLLGTLGNVVRIRSVDWFHFSHSKYFAFVSSCTWSLDEVNNWSTSKVQILTDL